MKPIYVIQRKKDKTFLTTSWGWNKELTHSKIFKRKIDLFEKLINMRTWNKTLRQYKKTDIKELNVFTIELGTLQKDIIKELKAQQTLGELQNDC